MELGRSLNLEPTRVNRLLKTLAALGLVRQTRDRKYTAGAGVHVLAAQSLYASGLIRRAVPVLERLHATGFTVALGVLWRQHVCYLYHGRTGMTTADALGTKGLFPAEQSGLGQVLLAYREPHTEVAGVSKKRLAQVRRQGWARVVRTRRPLEATLAVPIGQRPYAAVGLAGSIQASDRRKLLALLFNAAKQITKTEGDAP